MNNKISYTDYDRISDTLMYFDSNICLNFVVVLAKKNLSGNRQFYHYETEYSASKYVADVRSIKRNMLYYFVIDNKQDFGNGFIIRPMDAEMLIRIIEARILPWYFDTAKRAFQLIKDQLVLKEYEPVIYAQSTTKYLKFEPIVLSYDNNMYKEGIKIEINKYGVVTMDIDHFMGFLNILKTDMYCAATNLCLYVKCPPYGVNTYVRSGLGGGRVANDAWQNSDPTEKITKNNFLESAKEKKGKR